MSTERPLAVRTASPSTTEGRLRNVIDAYVVSPTFPSHAHPSLEAMSVAEQTSWSESAKFPKAPPLRRATQDHDLSAIAVADEEPDQSMYLSAD